MNDFLQKLTSKTRSLTVEYSLFNGSDIQIFLKDNEKIIDLIFMLQNDADLSFKMLVDIFPLDLLGKRKKRFQLIYHLLSVKFNQRIFIKIDLNEGEDIASITTVFPNANWYERESYDMFGIQFAGHPNLKRLLCDYEFDGFPLRKDFPLTGKVEVSYDEMEEKIVYKKVHLQQDYRNFDFLSPWEGPSYSEIEGKKE